MLRLSISSIGPNNFKFYNILATKFCIIYEYEARTYQHDFGGWQWFQLGCEIPKLMLALISKDHEVALAFQQQKKTLSIKDKSFGRTYQISCMTKQFTCFK